MSFKGFIKSAILGRPGTRERTIKVGLLRGLRFNVDTAEKSMRLIGFDEREIAADVRRLSAGVACAVDAGANDGWYSVYLASLANVKRVFAFEPNWSKDQLRANLALNASTRDKVEVIEKFVGDIDTSDTATIDGIGPRLTYPLLIKVDVEGAEMKVLTGAKRTLAEKDCKLVVETHSKALEEQCVEFLRPLGYSTRVISHGWYRTIIPEHRSLPHNRWLVAERT